MQIGFIIETWTGGECLPCQVSSVFVTGLQCDYQEEIWALESCHIPAHCKSPASSINLITAECTGQIFIGFSFSLLSPPLLNTTNSSLSSIPLKCERGRWRFCQHWLSDQIFLSIHTPPDCVLAARLDVYNEVSLYPLDGSEAGEQWLTHNDIVPDCQLDAPRPSLVFGVKLLHISHSPQQIINSSTITVLAGFIKSYGV